MTTYQQRIEKPRNVGIFHQTSMTIVEGRAKKEKLGIALKLQILIDPTDGIIVDARFQVLGPSYLIAALDITCELLLQKHYDQARRIKLELIEKHLPPLEDESLRNLSLILNALEEAFVTCDKLDLPKTIASPLPAPTTGEYPDWHRLAHGDKLTLLEKILNEEVRPYIELDEGGIEIQELKDNELHIAYSGACTSCYSSVGATLSTIQGILQAKVHPELVVIPNMDSLSLS